MQKEKNPYYFKLLGNLTQLIKKKPKTNRVYMATRSILFKHVFTTENHAILKPKWRNLKPYFAFWLKWITSTVQKVCNENIAFSFSWNIWNVSNNIKDNLICVCDTQNRWTILYFPKNTYFLDAETGLSKN